MALHNPPYYRYSLFEAWDKETYALIKQMTRGKRYPKIQGSHDDKNQFLITVIRTQKTLHNWRAMLVDTLEQIKNTGNIDTIALNKKYPPQSISKDIPAWVTYEEDKIVSDFIDELETRKVEFVGSDEELGQFVLRFILGQLGHDWEQTIILIWEILGKDTSLSLNQLNEEFRNFDYMHLFEHVSSQAK